MSPLHIFYCLKALLQIRKKLATSSSADMHLSLPCCHVHVCNFSRKSLVFQLVFVSCVQANRIFSRPSTIHTRTCLSIRAHFHKIDKTFADEYRNRKETRYFWPTESPTSLSHYPFTNLRQ